MHAIAIPMVFQMVGIYTAERLSGGDIDGSGVLSANDMTAFDNILAQGSYNVPPVVFEQADLNNDGVLDVIDRRGLQDLLDGRPQLYILKPEMK